MPVAGRASRFYLLEIITKIITAPEYGDVFKYLFTCKRLVVIHPRSLLEIIAMVTSVKLNVCSLSLYEVNRTSFVSLDYATVASTSSLFWVCSNMGPSSVMMTSWVSSKSPSQLVMISNKQLTRCFRKRLLIKNDVNFGMLENYVVKL